MKVGLLVYPGCVGSGLFAFAEMLSVASQRANSNAVQCSWLSADGKPIDIRIGRGLPDLKITRVQTLEDSVPDAIVVPGFWTSEHQGVEQTLRTNSSLTSALKQLPDTTRFWSYCTGVCLLAEASQLNGKNATATWWLSDMVQSRYPQVNWDLSQTMIADHNFITASGLNGYLPIAQHLISDLFGEQVLRDIVDLLVLPKPENTAQPFAKLKLIGVQHRTLREIFMWVEKTQATALNNQQLAESLHATSKTLSRLVQKHTGLTLGDFMRQIKLQQAGDLLVYGHMSVNAIALQLGYSDDNAFRRSFKKYTGFTPGEYRQRFLR